MQWWNNFGFGKKYWLGIGTKQGTVSCLPDLIPHRPFITDPFYFNTLSLSLFIHFTRYSLSPSSFSSSSSLFSQLSWPYPNPFLLRRCFWAVVRSIHNPQLLVCFFSLKMLSFFLFPSHLIFSNYKFRAFFPFIFILYTWMFCFSDYSFFWCKTKTIPLPQGFI